MAKLTRNDSIYNRVLYEKNFIHFSLKQYDSLIFFGSLLIKNNDLSKSHAYLGKQHHLLAYYFDEQAQIPDSAFYHYNLSKGYFARQKDSSQVGRRLLTMAQIQKNQNDFFGSKETLTEALQYLHAGRDDKYVASSYNALGTNHRKLLNYQDAIKYFSLAIDITRSLKDRLIYLNNLGATYVDNGQYNEAISLLESIVRDSTLLNNKKEYARVLDNLTYSHWLNGGPIKVEAFLEPLAIRKQNKDKRGKIASYTHLGEFYSKTNTRIATSYFDSVIQLSKTLKIPRAEKDALRFLMKLKPKNVNLRNRHIFLQDSLYAQELKVKTQFAKYKYDDRLKQESILRLEKEKAEKELEASQQRNQKILYLGGLLFITSVLGLSLYGFRQRTKRLKQKVKTEKLEAIHETEVEFSRKLHDDHGGKVNQAMLMVQRDTDKSIVLDKLESLYNQIRDFSREINAVDTGPDFWKGLKATLEYIKPIEVEMTFDGGKELDWSLVGHQTKTILFKVLQELVMNMARHSKANQTVILFRDQKKELSIYYEDDGVGASEESLLRKNGLQNTEKRIQAIGGSITFDSEEGKGFRAEIRIPK
ncbi:sensor histidine kinase [Maribacter sp. 2210JD10-5]|uniref:ATP-binding protein n=1 Tax=Maribacter sp. 2210JD10-5 TaxID=3386272 RepID=UPI0039BC30F7